VKVFTTLDRSHVGVVVAVQEADSNVPRVVGTKGCRTNVLDESSSRQVSDDLVFDIHAGVDGDMEAAVWRAAVGKADQIYAIINSFGRGCDALFRRRAVTGCEIPLLEPGE